MKDMAKGEGDTEPGRPTLASSGTPALTMHLLDDIIERLVNYSKYPGYTINEYKGGANANLPHILKEREIRLLIQAAEKIFKE